MTCCIRASACYRAIVAGDPSPFVRRAIVDPVKNPPEWRDVVTGNVLATGEFEPADCGERTPFTPDVFPQFIPVERAVLSPANNVRYNRWDDPTGTGANYTVNRHFSINDPVFGAPVRDATGGTHTHNEQIQSLTYARQATGVEAEMKDFWYLFPAATIGQIVQVRGITSGGQTTPGIAVSPDPSGPGTWQAAYASGISATVTAPLSFTMQEFDPCLTELGFAAARIRCFAMDAYYLGASSFSWREGTTGPYTTGVPNLTRRVLTRATYLPEVPLVGSQTVMRAKDGLGNVIDTGGNIITGEVCYDPPYATWPEPA